MSRSRPTTRLPRRGRLSGGLLILFSVRLHRPVTTPTGYDRAVGCASRSEHGSPKSDAVAWHQATSWVAHPEIHGVPSRPSPANKSAWYRVASVVLERDRDVSHALAYSFPIVDCGVCGLDQVAQLQCNVECLLGEIDRRLMIGKDHDLGVGGGGPDQVVAQLGAKVLSVRFGRLPAATQPLVDRPEG